MSVILGPRQRPEPDVILLRAEAVKSHVQTYYTPEAVALVAEVVPPESAERDRHRKSQLYAAACIPHFWRVEDEDGVPVVYAYKLDPVTSTYGLTGIHQGTLKVDVPFRMEVDLTEIDQM